MKLDKAEERVSELEDRAEKITQTVAQRSKKMKNMQEKLRDMRME